MRDSLVLALAFQKHDEPQQYPQYSVLGDMGSARSTFALLLPQIVVEALIWDR